VKWLKEGDGHSDFGHSTLRTRANTNAITQIEYGDRCLLKQQEIEEALASSTEQENGCNKDGMQQENGSQDGMRGTR